MINRRSVLKVLGVAPIASAIATLPAVAEIVKGKSVYDPRLGSRLIITNGDKELVIQAEKFAWIEFELHGEKEAHLAFGESVGRRRFDEFSRFTVRCYRYDGGDRKAVNFTSDFRDSTQRRRTGPIPYPHPVAPYA